MLRRNEKWWYPCKRLSTFSKSTPSDIQWNLKLSNWICQFSISNFEVENLDSKFNYSMSNTFHAFPSCLKEHLRLRCLNMICVIDKENWNNQFYSVELWWFKCSRIWMNTHQRIISGVYLVFWLYSFDCRLICWKSL